MKNFDDLNNQLNADIFALIMEQGPESVAKYNAEMMEVMVECLEPVKDDISFEAYQAMIYEAGDLMVGHFPQLAAQVSELKEFKDSQELKDNFEVVMGMMKSAGVSLYDSLYQQLELSRAALAVH